MNRKDLHRSPWEPKLEILARLYDQTLFCTSKTQSGIPGVQPGPVQLGVQQGCILPCACWWVCVHLQICTCVCTWVSHACLHFPVHVPGVLLHFCACCHVHWAAPSCSWPPGCVCWVCAHFHVHFQVHVCTPRTPPSFPPAVAHLQCNKFAYMQTHTGT